MQSRTGSESPMAVLIDERACSFIGERAEMLESGNFLSNEFGALLSYERRVSLIIIIHVPSVI